MRKTTFAVLALVALTRGCNCRCFCKEGAHASTRCRRAEKLREISQIRSTHVVDNSTIDFKMAGGKTYRNSLPHSCPGLRLRTVFLSHFATSLLQRRYRSPFMIMAGV